MLLWNVDKYIAAIKDNQNAVIPETDQIYWLALLG